MLNAFSICYKEISGSNRLYSAVVKRSPAGGFSVNDIAQFKIPLQFQKIFCIEQDRIYKMYLYVKQYASTLLNLIILKLHVKYSK